MEDQSILSQNSGTVNQAGINEYANELIKEVCLNGDSFSKYQKLIEKRFGSDFFEKCDNFVTEVRRSIKNKKFSDSSIINLKYLAKEINIPTDTVDIVTSHFIQQFEEEEEQTAESKMDDQKSTDEDKANKGKGGKYKWIVLLILAFIGIGVYFAFNHEKEEPLSLQVVNFVSQTEMNAESYDIEDWKKASNTIDSLKHEYAINYNKLSPEELDIVDDAIDRYNMIFRQYREIPFEEDTTKIIFDGIEFNFEKPTNEKIDEWKEQYSNICTNKVAKMDKEDFSIPKDMLEKQPCLVYLILKSKSMSSSKKKQEWFDLYSLMNSKQLYSLYDILYRELFRLGKIDKKCDIQEKASKFNTEAYEFAKDSDFYNAKITIDKAKMLMPDDANYYDSEGEFCIMQGRTERALSLWNKVMELDPDFLQKVKGGSTTLYEKLKEQGLIE